MLYKAIIKHHEEKIIANSTNYAIAKTQLNLVFTKIYIVISFNNIKIL